jgi:hypothetical protein
VDGPPTIIGLVERAVRAWLLAVTNGEDPDPRGSIEEAAYSEFYIDPSRPDRIRTSGLAEDRCGLWVEPSDVVLGPDGTTLLVDVKLAFRRDGQPVETEFQVSFSEALKPVIH